MAALGERVVESVTSAFARVDPGDLERSYRRFVPVAVTRISAAQVTAARLSNAYLSAFVFSEVGRRVPVRVDARPLVGRSRDGRSLTESLEGPLIGMKAGIKHGRFGTFDEAAGFGLRRVGLLAEMDGKHPGRWVIETAVNESDLFDGWERVTTGTCGACLAVAGRHRSLRFHVHPACKCVQEPVLKNVELLLPRPTGKQLFDGKTRDEQDAALGAAAAEAVRNGLPLSALSEVKHVTGEPDWIVQGPVPDRN